MDEQMYKENVECMHSVALCSPKENWICDICRTADQTESHYGKQNRADLLEKMGFSLMHKPSI